ncbi:MAG: DUF2914 domain-containing protein [Desulfobulbaceae bacterium]|nr:DUF2914 domain-containing protein [Desulfobulbaceae bacterium]
MASKISINIDLRDSKRVSPPSVPLPDKISSKQTKTSTIEYHYRYDRIFLLIAVLFIIVFFSFYLFFLEDEVTADKVLQTEQIDHIVTKEKHLSVSNTIPAPPHTYSIYLFYKEIDVLDAFYFPRKNKHSEQKDAVLKNKTQQSITESPEEKQVIKTVPTEENEEVISASLIKSEKKPAPLKKNENNFIQINSNNLSRVLLVSNIYKKEPLNELSYNVYGKEDRAEKIYLFTQVNNNVGQTIEHQWWYQGKMVHKRKFTILGKRWRCYSSKNIGKFQQGQWLIKVMDEKNNILSTVHFQYQVN